MQWRQKTLVNGVVSRRYVFTAACCLCHALDWLQFVNAKMEANAKQTSLTSHQILSAVYMLKNDANVMSAVSDFRSPDAATSNLLLRDCPPAPAARFASLRINLKDSGGT